jgi:rhodanese-related sulfurtransferase
MSTIASTTSKTLDQSAALNGPHGLRAGADALPRAVADALRAGTAVLVDVREPDEHAKERIAGARLLPLSRFDPSSLSSTAGQTIVIHCRSGRRSADAVARCGSLQAAGIPVVSLAGGIEAWKAAGLPIESTAGAPRLGVMQQTQLTIGLGILTGLALGFFVHPAGLLISAFMGGGLVMAGLTGACPLASGLARMPWNRRFAGSCGASCAPPRQAS